jgi:hypothetical protein
MEPTECSETLAFNIQTPGKYPEDNIPDMKKLIVAFRKIANAVKNGYLFCNKHANTLCGQILSYSRPFVQLPLVFKGFNHIPLLSEGR